jgi:hypothetical protein
MSNKRSKSTNYSSNTQDKNKNNNEPNDHQKPEFIKGEERKVHEEIIEKRIGGGVPPSPGLYASALRQWQHLPGSVVRSATDVKLPIQKPLSAQKNGPTSEQRDNDTDREQSG